LCYLTDLSQAPCFHNQNPLWVFDLLLWFEWKLLEPFYKKGRFGKKMRQGRK